MEQGFQGTRASSLLSSVEMHEVDGKWGAWWKGGDFLDSGLQPIDVSLPPQPLSTILHISLVL